VKTFVSHTDGIVTITDANTTIGYCRYDPSGEIEYLFVSPTFRRRGYAKRMLDIVEAQLGISLHFAPPISPLGRHVVGSYRRGRQAVP
jgi:GNAT superfamily N-acetyltransferase